MPENVYPCRACGEFIDMDNEAIAAVELTEDRTQGGLDYIEGKLLRLFHVDHFTNDKHWRQKKRGLLRAIIPKR
jgi:hypothetical protein